MRFSYYTGDLKYLEFSKKINTFLKVPGLIFFKKRHARRMSIFLLFNFIKKRIANLAEKKAL